MSAKSKQASIHPSELSPPSSPVLHLEEHRQFLTPPDRRTAVSLNGVVWSLDRLRTDGDRHRAKSPPNQANSPDNADHNGERENKNERDSSTNLFEEKGKGDLVTGRVNAKGR